MLPAGLYEILPPAYLTTATVGIFASDFSVLGLVASGLLTVAAARIVYLRIHFRRRARRLTGGQHHLRHG